MNRLLIILLGCGLLAACNPEIGQYVPPRRDYVPSVVFPEQNERPLEGAIWTPTQAGNFLLMDQRAMRVGDLVMVVVRETADAKRGAATEVSRNSQMSNAINDLFAVLKYLQPGLAGAELLGATAESDFSGNGMTSRTESLSARVAATVKQVLPNGNLFIEGHREILVNREAQHFYISGVVRQSDITDGNTVESSRIADAQIEFNGRGVVSDVQGPGALTRALNQYNPF